MVNRNHFCLKCKMTTAMKFWCVWERKFWLWCSLKIEKFHSISNINNLKHTSIFDSNPNYLIYQVYLRYIYWYINIFAFYYQQFFLQLHYCVLMIRNFLLSKIQAKNSIMTWQRTKNTRKYISKSLGNVNTKYETRNK